MSELVAALHDECPTTPNARRTDLDQSINHENFWAADRGLSNVLASLGLETERFSSVINFNQNFVVSYSARRRDQSFGLTFDGLTV